MKPLSWKQLFLHKEIILFLPVLIFLMILTSCNSASEKSNNSISVSNESSPSTETSDNSLDSAVSFLLESSAKDFYEHQKPSPLGFRNVQLKSLSGSDSIQTYLLCGEFLTHDNQNQEVWHPFATIKTSGYEQWIGSGSLAYCQNSRELSYKTIDLSSELKSRFDFLQEKSK